MRITRRTTLLAFGAALWSGFQRLRGQSTEPETITPADLAALLKKPADERPLVVQVGVKVLYDKAHVPGAEFIGPANDANGIAQLRKRVEPLKRDRSIVIYCGCCPWEDCPNVQPAATLLTSMGFRNMRALYIADNFGSDWVAKGYPTELGQ